MPAPDRPTSRSTSSARSARRGQPAPRASCSRRAAATAAQIRDKQILAEALSIHTVEARHAAALNSLAGKGFRGGARLVGSLPDGAFAKPMAMAEVLRAVKPFIAKD